MKMEKFIKGNILLVGEGDFSFAVSLLEKLPSNRCTGITATSLETPESIKKHQYAAKNIEYLKEKGVTVRLDTDATQLHINPCTRDKRFSCIIFNFPHAGGKSNHKKNRKLLNDFFASAVQVLEGEGQIMMTLCKGQGGTPADQPMRAWHDSWQVVSMAADSGLILTNIVPFRADEYRVYTSTGFRSLDKGFNTENALTHVFEMAGLVKVPDGTSQVKVKLGHSIFLCRPYIYNKLQQIRYIKSNINHPFHRVYERFLKSLSSNTASKVENQGLRSPIKVNAPRVPSFENRLLLDDDTRYKLVQSNISVSEEFDDDLSDLIDETEVGKITGDEKVLGLDWNPLVFAGSEDLNILRVKYGPVCKPCDISVTQSPVSYIMTLTWPVSIDENIAGDLEFQKDDVTKAVDEILSKVTHIFNDLLINSTRKIEITNDNIDNSIVQILSQDLVGILYLADISICNRTLNTAEETVFHNMENKKSVKIGDCKLKLIDDDMVPKSSIVTIYFSVDLCKFACCVYSIENEKLLWSTDARVLSQFSELEFVTPIKSPESRCNIGEVDRKTDKENKQDNLKSSESHAEVVVRNLECGLKDFCIKSPSLYPMTFVHDMSFWENECLPFCMSEYCDIIRDVAGDSVIDVKLLDKYEETVSGKTSRCYRLTFQSADKCLSYDTSWKLQSLIRLKVEKKMKIGLR